MKSIYQYKLLHLPLWIYCLSLLYSCSNPDKFTLISSVFNNSKPIYLELIIDRKSNDTLYSLQVGLDSLADIKFKVDSSINIIGSLMRAKVDFRGAFEDKIRIRLQQLSGDHSNLKDSFYQKDKVVFAGYPIEDIYQLAGMNGDYILMYNSENIILKNTLAEQDRLRTLYNFFLNYSGRSDVELISVQIDKNTTRFFVLN